MSASVITGTCAVVATTAAPKTSCTATSCIAEPPGYFRERHAAQHDERVGQIFRRAAEAERGDELREIGEEERADDSRDYAALGEAAERIAADHDRRNGAEQI